MTLSDQLLASLLLYGLPVLFATVFLASIGFPLPASLLLITTGAFTAQGHFDLRIAALLAIIAAVLGDHVGYALGRWGGRQAVVRVTGWIGGGARLEQAEAAVRRWGGIGVFLSRWLLAPIGPAINLTSGIVRYSWPKFASFDITGEILWVVLYMLLGRMFGGQIEAISGLLGDVTWWLCGALVALVLAVRVARHLRSTRGGSRPATNGGVSPRAAPPRSTSESDIRAQR